MNPLELKINSVAARVCFVALLAVACGASFSARAQSAPAADQELTISDLLKLPGKVIAKEKAKAQDGDGLKLMGYRVEEVELPRAADVELRGKKIRVAKAFRVVVLGGPFQVRALPPVVWIDDAAVGYGVENEDLDEITAVTYDDSILRDGATLYLSYGDKETKDGRAQVPVKLKLEKHN